MQTAEEQAREAETADAEGADRAASGDAAGGWLRFWPLLLLGAATVPGAMLYLGGRHL
ncbi:hypothetical protein [Streptomyces pluripotens]|uniref:hypothetical protein n=1 Tax=Streptomyces pluripotens TaxID=1355015 RepID=UPI000A7E1A79|nr:hypothetical protein [Streptomyces pluripotens]